LIERRSDEPKSSLSVVSSNPINTLMFLLAHPPVGHSCGPTPRDNNQSNFGVRRWLIKSASCLGTSGPSNYSGFEKAIQFHVVLSLTPAPMRQYFSTGAARPPHQALSTCHGDPVQVKRIGSPAQALQAATLALGQPAFNITPPQDFRLALRRRRPAAAVACKTLRHSVFLTWGRPTGKKVSVPLS